MQLRPVTSRYMQLNAHIYSYDWFPGESGLAVMICGVGNGDRF
jgi:hypothetical protein